MRAVAAVADGGVKIRMERAQFLKSLPRVFYRLDVDGSGSIDMAEMRTAMQDCGVACTDVEMASMFIEADIDGDGSIDFAEFSSLMTNLYAGQSGSFSTRGQVFFLGRVFGSWKVTSFRVYSICRLWLRGLGATSAHFKG